MRVSLCFKCKIVDIGLCDTGHRVRTRLFYTCIFSSLKPCSLCFELVLRVETRFCDFDIYNVCMFETCTYSIIRLVPIIRQGSLRKIIIYCVV